MIVAKKSTEKITNRILNARKAALNISEQPNETQKILERVYGKTTHQILESYSAYKDNWGKYIDIGD